MVRLGAIVPNATMGLHISLKDQTDIAEVVEQGWTRLKTDL